jgi:hypothetical protein
VLPLAQADFSRVQAVFTDVDGTLTTRGRLEAVTLKALEWLVAHGVKVVLVSGRPSGWGEAWARQLPVAGVIVENGGLWYVPGEQGLEKHYWEPEGERQQHRAKLVRAVKKALQVVPGARLSMDSAATEVDLAIDYNEEARLGHAGADALEQALARAGVTAVRSSVHVNCWVGDFDKRKAVARFIDEAWGTTLKKRDPRFVYVGDSFNDEPLFEGFKLSVGVANVRDVLDRITHPPRYITRAREGRGFAEVADAVARARRQRKTP